MTRKASPDMANLADGPIEWSFGDKTIKFQPFKLGDFAAAEAWAREMCRRDLFELTKELTVAERVQILKGGPSPYDIAARIDSIEGKLYMLHRAAKKYQPEMTLEELGDLSFSDIGLLIDALYLKENEEESALPPQQAETGQAG